MKAGAYNVILLGIKTFNYTKKSDECSESNDETKCTSCTSERNLISSKCLCNDGTYSNPSKVCTDCDTTWLIIHYLIIKFK